MHEENLEAKVKALESRIARLEARLDVRPVPVALPAVPPAAPAAPPAPTPRREPLTRTAAPEANSTDLERFVGLSVFGRIGIGAVLLAATYFGQLGWTQLGGAARVAIVYVAGFALVALGAVLRARVAPKYIAQLWGGGIALTYLAGALAHLRYEILGSAAALTALLLSTALGQFLAIRLRVEAMATIALIGAYSAPLLVGEVVGSTTGVLTLYLVLHTFAALAERQWNWGIARLTAVVLTVVLMCAWLRVPHAMPLGWSLVAHIEVLWLGLAAPELWNAARRRDASVHRGAWIFFFGVLWHGWACLAIHLETGRESVPTLAFVIPAALLAAGVWYRSRAPEIGVWIARTGAVLLPFVAMLGGVKPELLLASAVTLVVLRRFTGVGDLGVAFAVMLALPLAMDDGMPSKLAIPLALAVLSMATATRSFGRVVGLLGAILVLFDGLDVPWRLTGDGSAEQALAIAGACAFATLGLFLGELRRDVVLTYLSMTTNVVVLGIAVLTAAAPPAGAAELVPHTLLWNVRFGAFAAIVVAATVGRRIVPDAESGVRVMLAAVALIAAFVGGLAELVEFVAGRSFGVRSVAVSLYVLAFAAGLLVAGFRRKLPALRWAALWGFGFVALKVVVHDLSGLDVALRILATGVLGVVLLTASWAYARLQRPAA
jgi:hypothetical protein